MNVAHLVFSFENGGIENLLVDMLNNWPKSNKVVLCIINNLKSNELLSKIKNKENVLIYELDRKPNSNFTCTIKSIYKLYKIIKENNINIIHCHSRSVLKFASPLKILIPKIKYYLTIHATGIYNNISHLNMIFDKFILTKMFAISVPVKDEIINKGFPSRKTVLLYNATDSKKFLPKNKMLNSKKRIICVARLIPKIKGQDILIKALNCLKEKNVDFECYIVGAEPSDHPEYLQQIMKLINDYQLGNYVKLLGNRDDVPYLLSQCDIFVLPSREEGFGISVIEAMLSKVLVIVSNVRALKDLIGDNQYGYVFENENYVELADILNKVINSNNKKIVDNAYSYAINNYEINIMIKKLCESYKK